MNRIKLRRPSGAPFHADMDRVAEVYRDINSGKTTIEYDADSSVFVLETVEEVLRLEQEGKAAGAAKGIHDFILGQEVTFDGDKFKVYETFWDSSGECCYKISTKNGSRATVSEYNLTVVKLGDGDE